MMVVKAGVNEQGQPKAERNSTATTWRVSVANAIAFNGLRAQAIPNVPAPVTPVLNQIIGQLGLNCCLTVGGS
jgi:hypothetical protein